MQKNFVMNFYDMSLPVGLPKQNKLLYTVFCYFYFVVSVSVLFKTERSHDVCARHKLM